MSQIHNIPPEHILPRRVATSAFAIDVSRATLVTRGLFGMAVKFYLAPSLVPEQPVITSNFFGKLNDSNFFGKPIMGSMMFMRIPSGTTSKFDHFVAYDFCSEMVNFFSYDSLLAPPYSQTVPDFSMPLFISPDRSKILCSIEDALVAKPINNNFSSYAISYFEVFDPFCEKMVMMHDAIPFLDEILPSGARK